MKILFISHSYPPILGGVESQNYNLAQSLSSVADVKIIANGRGKSFLPFFLPWAFFQAFFTMMNYDICLLGNGVLAPLGAILKFFHHRKKFFCIVHGLDITFANRKGFLPNLYRHINIPSLKNLTKLFMVGNATIEEAFNVGIEREHCVFIPNGVNVQNFRQNHQREELSQLFGRNVKDKRVILRLGRFVPHKGTSWFIDQVMPKLPKNVVMIATGHRVARNTTGDQDDFMDCEQAIIENNLQDQVKLLPSLAQKNLLVLLNTVDLVVSPNIKVPGTMEGFGINVIEAGACNRVVLASDLEGLSDAIKSGKNGILVTPENADEWVKKINAIFEAGDEFIQVFGNRSGEYVSENYSWSHISQLYLEAIKAAE